MLRGASEHHRKAVLRFCTSCQTLPAGGFASLPNRIRICKTEMPLPRLPVAHTCFSELLLPLYKSKVLAEYPCILSCLSPYSSYCNGLLHHSHSSTFTRCMRSERSVHCWLTNLLGPVAPVDLTHYIQVDRFQVSSAHARQGHVEPVTIQTCLVPRLILMRVACSG